MVRWAKVYTKLRSSFSKIGKLARSKQDFFVQGLKAMRRPTKGVINAAADLSPDQASASY